MKTKAFKNFFLSKCLELKALSTLKVSLKSEKLFVRCEPDPVEIPCLSFEVFRAFFLKGGGSFGKTK